MQKRVGRQPDRPGRVQEKVERVHDRAADEEVAVAVTRDVLSRPLAVMDYAGPSALPGVRTPASRACRPHDKLRLVTYLS
ncbi:DUF6192 family protein [Streptomyces sp. AS02]|uniref:DUF6192 family protein n=1 Tax=Streptomyces sp. AS02 TaxID=2938946 RepID=UPI00202091A0|nr:DUF6192 family protein [Streptomyces sp. AS02]MCL8016261.1 DUF6192 family protein [Streptomyces sp. AS02]